MHVWDLFSRFHWISSGLIIAPAETTREKVPSYTSLQEFVWQALPPNDLSSFCHLQNETGITSAKTKTTTSNSCPSKSFADWGKEQEAALSWPWMRLALGVSFKSRNRFSSNQVTRLDTKKRSAGCFQKNTQRFKLAGKTPTFIVRRTNSFHETIMVFVPTDHNMDASTSHKFETAFWHKGCSCCSSLHLGLQPFSAYSSSGFLIAGSTQKS